MIQRDNAPERELRECPFCGAQESHGLEVHCVSGSPETHDDYYAVGCVDCAGHGPESDSPQEAISSWNTRPSPGWIPVSERLPDKPKDEDRPVFYLIASQGRVSMTELAVDYITEEPYFCRFAEYWMPLPNPPQEDSRDE